MLCVTLLSVLPIVRPSPACPSEGYSSPDAHALLQVQQRIKPRSPLSMDEDPSKTVQSLTEDPSALLELQAASEPALATFPDCEEGNYKDGDGVGGWERKIGHASSPQRCIDMVKAQCSTANGATLPSSGSGQCYCEFGMNTWNAVARWQSCKFTTTTTTTTPTATPTATTATTTTTTTTTTTITTTTTTCQCTSWQGECIQCIAPGAPGCASATSSGKCGPNVKVEVDGFDVTWRATATNRKCVHMQQPARSVRFCGPGKLTLGRMTCENHDYKSLTVEHCVASYTTQCETVSLAGTNLDGWIGSLSVDCR